MASDDKFVAFIREQMAGAGPISARKMFGEYAIYCGDKVVALICDNQLFVKPTVIGKALLGDPSMAPPFPGAKPFFLIDDVDDGEFLASVIAATARELPAPKPKTAKKNTAEKNTAKKNTAKKQALKPNQARKARAARRPASKA